MSYVETDVAHVIRDTTSRALLNNDKEALKKTRIMRATTQQAKFRQNEIDKRMQLMHERLDRCELLLHELVQHISSLVAKIPELDANKIRD